ncbi:MAG: hypothetical protein QXE93_00385 [Candidatus Pacearchaeota archaeon]
MKLLKKIAPIAVGAVLGLATMGGAIAADLGTWKNNFPAANTVVVAYDSDAAAIAEIANYLGLRGGTTITGESWEFKKSTDKLNLGENLSTIRSTISKEKLQKIIADGTYIDTENDEFGYTQKISIGNLTLTHFQSEDYKNNEPTLGFELASGAFVLNYTLKFTTEPSIDNMEGTSINMLGKEYYISDITNESITLLETSTRATVTEGESVTLAGKKIEIAYFTGTETERKVVLLVDGVETNPLAEGKTYKLRDGTVIGVKTIIYDTRQGYKSKVVVTVGTGKIYIEKGEEVEINGKAVDGLKGYVEASGDKLKSITLEWTADDEYYIGSGDELVMPGIGSLKLLMSGMTFSSEEKIVFGYDGSKKAKITVPIKSGTKDITFLEGNGTNWTSTAKLKINDTLLNLTKNDEFLITCYSEEEGETYYAKVIDFDEEKATISYDGNTIEVEANVTYEIGECEIKVTEASETTQTLIIKNNTNTTFFDRIVTNKGALIWLPKTKNITDAKPYEVDIIMFEKDDNENIGRGKNITVTYEFINEKASVKSVDAEWAGGGLLEKEEDYEVGYVESKYATKAEYDMKGAQYKATLIHFGEEVYGNVFIAGAGAAAGGGEVAITYPELTESMKATKNIISIGGSGVNPFSAELLFGSPTLVYGSDSRWVSATGVDGVGKALVQLYQGTSACQKVCLLVAGFEASDTLKAAKFLTTKADELTGKTKAVLDTTGSEASVITT